MPSIEVLQWWDSHLKSLFSPLKIKNWEKESVIPKDIKLSESMKQILKKNFDWESPNNGSKFAYFQEKFVHFPQKMCKNEKLIVENHESLKGCWETPKL